jgi:hypothetical protein
MWFQHLAASRYNFLEPDFAGACPSRFLPVITLRHERGRTRRSSGAFESVSRRGIGWAFGGVPNRSTGAGADGSAWRTCKRGPHHCRRAIRIRGPDQRCGLYLNPPTQSSAASLPDFLFAVNAGTRLFVRDRAGDRCEYLPASSGAQCGAASDRTHCRPSARRYR